MSDFGQLALIMIVAFVGNIVPTATAKKDVTPVVFANAVLFIVLALVGSAWSFTFAKALAGLYLLATFLRSGSQVVDTIVELGTGIAETGTSTGTGSKT